MSKNTPKWCHFWKKPIEVLCQQWLWFLELVIDFITNALLTRQIDHESPGVFSTFLEKRKTHEKVCFSKIQWWKQVTRTRSEEGVLLVWPRVIIISAPTNKKEENVRVLCFLRFQEVGGDQDDPVFRRFRRHPYSFDDFWSPKNKKNAEMRNWGGRKAASAFSCLVRRWHE